MLLINKYMLLIIKYSVLCAINKDLFNLLNYILIVDLKSKYLRAYNIMAKTIINNIIMTIWMLNKWKKIGPTEIRTRINGFKVQCANRYTIGPINILLNLQKKKEF